MNTPYKQEHVDQLYRLIGEAVWHLQHLENVVASFTTFKVLQAKREKGKRLKQADVERALGKQKGQTLVPLIGNAKSHKTIPPHLVKRFDVFLSDRNWLIHNCVTDEFLSLRNKEERQRLFQRVAEVSQQAIALQGEIHGLFEDWFTELGYDLGESYELAEELLKNAEQS
ncbi:glutathione S-transferase family protein [Methylophaga thalassica]|uniref:hypothetical protein n=1 Tax=Methylophaga aminisulfidivorans TaxID=230105 RepID=UPI0024E20580|nr:hypothetical protein [Methylophaga aminisulfidivorans]